MRIATIAAATLIFAGSLNQATAIGPLERAFNSPQTSVKRSSVDIQKVAEDDRQHTRYLSLYNIPEGKRDDYEKILCLIANCFSTSKKISKLERYGEIVRVDLRNYNLLSRMWDSLPMDPYFYVEADKPHLGPWLNKRDAESLCQFTKTNTPIHRADWFIDKVTTAPLYYKILKVSNESEFLKLFNHDPKAAEKARARESAIVTDSRTSRFDRQYIRYPTLNGYIWMCMDGSRLNDFLKSKYDQKLIVASLPNGLRAYCIVDNRGKLLNHLNPELSIDVRRRSNLFDIKSMFLSHGFVEEVKDVLRDLLGSGDIKLIINDEKTRRKIEELFGGRLSFRKDQEVYAESVKSLGSMEDLT